MKKSYYVVAVKDDGVRFLSQRGMIVECPSEEMARRVIVEEVEDNKNLGLSVAELSKADQGEAASFFTVMNARGQLMQYQGGGGRMFLTYDDAKTAASGLVVGKLLIKCGPFNSEEDLPERLRGLGAELFNMKKGLAN